MHRSRFAGALKGVAPGAARAPREAGQLLLAGMVAIGLSLVPGSPASAAGEPCRAIKSEKERLACFDRGVPAAQGGNAPARPATDPRAAPPFVDPAEWMKDENDKVAARLKGICRGC
jgi:hypothetical protein